MDNRVTVFREIHKNTWLKRLTIDNKKVTVGTKKSDRTWVVFCVHDDTEAILEGYIEPRQAAFHIPEWTVPLQTTLHISHALVPSESEYEFVITLAADVVRFNAASWEIMQEWVETLRQKLREMKILSPKENLYSKLPEIRAPLLPTRDPTSPLPAPPPVPAAIVPGIEQIPTTNNQLIATVSNASRTTTSTVTTTSPSTTATTTSSTVTSTNQQPSTSSQSQPTLPPPTAMSNTLTQNLLNMLSSPVTAYSSHVTSINEIRGSDSSGASIMDDDDDDDDSFFFDANETLSSSMPSTSHFANLDLSATVSSSSADTKLKKELINHSDNMSLAKTFSNNVLADPNTCPSTSSGILQAAVIHQNREIDTETSSSTASTPSAIYQQEPPIVIPRPQTTRSSARSKRIPLPGLQIQTPPTTKTVTTDESSSSTNITIIQVSSPLTLASNSSKDIFNFPSVNTSLSIVEQADNNYKSNVQIIPSNFSPTPSSAIVATKFLAKKLSAPFMSSTSNNDSSSCNFINNSNKVVTTVQVSGASPPPTTTATGYGKIISQACAIFTNNNGQQQNLSSNVLTTLKNFAGPITNIPIGTSSSTSPPSSAITIPPSTLPQQLHYEQVFITPSTSTAIISSSTSSEIRNNHTNNAATATSTNSISDGSQLANNGITSASIICKTAATTLPQTLTSITHTDVHVNRINLQNTRNKAEQNIVSSSTSTENSSTIVAAVPSTSTIAINSNNGSQLRNNSNSINNISSSGGIIGSSNSNSNAISNSKKHVITGGKRENLPSPLPAIRKFLTRGLTEAAIIRPSRKDNATNAVVPLRRDGRNKLTNTSNNAENQPSNDTQQQEIRQQRRRSSSTSDAQGVRSRTNASNNISSPPMNEARRMQPAPQPFRLDANTHHASGRLTLREQQVYQLRREMMHPGGVRLQLRRKDCTGSIALVDAFGAVWISGWKQKEHPVLFNALHIGDQLVSVAGINVNCAADANRIIRNSPGLYIELIIRRIPFGRVYAIRRELDGQCIGLIRDGNTSTIVDVVPNSLSARHGLPPKSQTCDGLSLTFWVLTEINGRPLNLFFKDNEVRDRLNAVGRDISILVQPSDLIVKLKKQLKSLRGYKDYIVQ